MDRDQIITAVDKLAELKMMRKSRIANNWYTCFCPFHAGGQEKKPAFGILLQDQVKAGQSYPAGWCHCFACGYVKNFPEMITDLLKLKDISLDGFQWLKDNVPGFDEGEGDFEYLIPEDVIKNLNNTFAVEYLNERIKGPKSQYVTEEELSSYRFTVQYMYDRKLTDEVIEKYDIGFDPNFVLPGRKKSTPCITMPVHDKDGNVLFFCRRAIDVKIYNYPENVLKPVYGIYQLPKGCKSVIICESIINALTAVVYGYCAVALMGTGNAYQIDQLKRLGVQEFVLCMDPDDAGRRGAKKLKNALKSVALVWNISLPDGKDLNDLESKAEFDYYYSMKE